MRMFKYFLCLALLALAIVPACSAQQAIILVRHAEKAAGAMADRDVPLSKAGERRARLLADLLKDAGITAIYTSATVRTQATAQPLSIALGVPINNLDQHHPQAAIQRLKKENANDVVLVVGHSDTLPGLLEALGYRRKITILPSEYKDLFVVIPHAGKAPSVLRVSF